MLRLRVPILGSILLLVLLIVSLILPTQLYGNTVSCDPTFNLTNQTNCGEKSSSSNSESMDDLVSDDIETPLILPDISPTREDLDSVERDDRGKTTDSGDTENNVETYSDNEEESQEETNDNDSEENDGEEVGDTHLLIPFP